MLAIFYPCVVIDYPEKIYHIAMSTSAASNLSQASRKNIGNVKAGPQLESSTTNQQNIWFGKINKI
ncbi:MAG: hypothetical protein COA79_01385 [Planctomycetota bacterium]|nr:MAG: hypothetical protein COA79_01385 [Planctomycetota bacterium]